MTQNSIPNPDNKQGITLTERAAAQVQVLRKDAEDPSYSLRLFIEKGGCSGFEYGMAFTPSEPDDHEFISHGVSILVDPHSFKWLAGICIDFDDSLRGRGFEIKNPNAAHTCGCGKSFH